MTTVRPSKVYIVSEMSEVGCGRGNMDRKTVLCHTVKWEWAGVDRKEGGGMSCAADRKKAERLVAAINAGHFFKNAEIKSDIDGATYVSSFLGTTGRYLETELKQLGF